MLLKGQRSPLRAVCILCILFLGGQVYGASAADESCDAARVSQHSCTITFSRWQTQKKDRVP